MTKLQRTRLFRALGYAVSAACLGVLALNVDWLVFASHFRNLQLLPIAVAVLLVAVTYFLFALRWRLLLSFAPRPPFMQVASFLMLGYLGNLILPMRAGDAARVLLIRNAYGYGMARAFSSILLERVLDVIAVLAFGVAIAFAAPLPEGILLILRSAAAIVSLAIIVLVWIAARPTSAIRVVERLLRPFSPALGRATAYHSTQFSEALAVVLPTDQASVRRVAAIFVLTGLGWASYGAAMVLCTAAFDVLPCIAAGLLMMVVTNLGSAIPSSPGSLGVYHALGVLALSAWHVELNRALSVATVSHAIVVGVQLLLGLVAMGLVGRQRNVLSAARMAKLDG